MKKHLLVDQFLPSGCGFKIIRVVEVNKSSPFGAGKFNSSTFTLAQDVAPDSNFRFIKKWCSDNCSGTWGYTSKPDYKSGQRDGKYFTEWHYYFCFLEETDILAIRLLLDEVKIRPMWPSRARFTIFVYENE